MLYKAFGRSTGGKAGFVLFAVPIPHILGCNLNIMLPCKGQQLKIHFGVFLGRFIVVGVDNAYFPACFCGAFYRAL